MADRKQIIDALEICCDGTTCDDCPYEQYHGDGCFDRHLMRDALALLKEQEAVTIKKTKEHGFGVYGGICPKCCNWIQSAHSFCGFCGQAVKWE